MTIYAPDPDKTRMFSLPRYLIIRGEIVLDDTELRSIPSGHTLRVAIETNPDALPDIEREHDQSASIAFANFGVEPEEMGPSLIVPRGRGHEEGI